MTIVIGVELFVLLRFFIADCTSEPACLDEIVVHPGEACHHPLPVQFPWLLVHLDKGGVEVDGAPLGPHIVAGEEAVLRLPVAVHLKLHVVPFRLLERRVFKQLHELTQRLFIFLHLDVLVPNDKRVYQAAPGEIAIVDLLVPA